MSSAASLYGSMPASSTNGMSGLSGVAMDWGQFASSNNLFPSGPTDLEKIGAGIGVASTLLGGVADLISSNKQAKTAINNINSQMKAVAESRDRYLMQYNRASKQLNAQQVVSYISSGLSLDNGTPQVVMAETTKQRQLERGWNEMNFETELQNLAALKESIKKESQISSAFGAVKLGLDVVSGGLTAL